MAKGSNGDKSSVSSRIRLKYPIDLKIYFYSMLSNLIFIHIQESTVCEYKEYEATQIACFHF